MDEIQIAAKKDQTLFKFFKEAGFYNKENLLKNDVKIIEFTATPDGTIYDLDAWGENSYKIRMKPGPGYTSCFDLKSQNRVRQYKDLYSFDKIKKEINIDLLKKYLKEIKDIIESYDEPLYHIIRTPNATKGESVIKEFYKLFW